VGSSFPPDLDLFWRCFEIEHVRFFSPKGVLVLAVRPVLYYLRAAASVFPILQPTVPPLLNFPRSPLANMRTPTFIRVVGLIRFSDSSRKLAIRRVTPRDSSSFPSLSGLDSYVGNSWQIPP